ncbi:hypothetical protein BC941DRAFT_436643, partial [Chlamydoabsidia padenii]
MMILIIVVTLMMLMPDHFQLPLFSIRRTVFQGTHHWPSISLFVFEYLGHLYNTSNCHNHIPFGKAIRQRIMYHDAPRRIAHHQI